MSPLEQSVSRGVVRIGPGANGYDGRSVHFWGSGFFVAPEWVLTCAHVVVGKGAVGVDQGQGQGPEELLRVALTTYDEQRLSGQVVRVLPDDDLALVRVAGADFQDCLWLSDRSGSGLADVQLFGWAQTAGPDLGEEFLSPTAMATGGGHRQPIMLQSALVFHGLSGGPVVDRVNGAVVGVIKGKGQSTPTYGRAAPVSRLRTLCDEPGSPDARLWHGIVAAHDRHHLDRYRSGGDCWPRDQKLLAAGSGQSCSFSPDIRAQLYGLFAELPPPSGAGQVLRLVNAARGRVLRGPLRPGPDAPCDWRDGTGLLHDPREGTEAAGPQLELEAVVVYAAMVYAAMAPAAVDGPREAVALDRLRRWAEDTGQQLGNEVIRRQVPGLLGAPSPQEPDAAAAAEAAAHDDVLVVIGPEFYGTYRWRVQLLGSDGTTTMLLNDDEGAPRERLEEAVREGLHAAFVRADANEHLAAVDFMLPRALFDEPFEEWRSKLPRPGQEPSVHTYPIGQRRIVALRDQQRRGDGATPEWHRGWKSVENGPLEAVPLCLDVVGSRHGADCEESAEAAYNRLRVGASGAVPVHCASTAAGHGSQVLTRAFHVGHAAALCRRLRDNGHNDCAEFHERAAELIRQAGTGRALRERIRELRNLNADPDRPNPDTAWARHIVLIYDPPHRPVLPHGPLRQDV